MKILKNWLNKVLKIDEKLNDLKFEILERTTSANKDLRELIYASNENLREDIEGVYQTLDDKYLTMKDISKIVNDIFNPKVEIVIPGELPYLASEASAGYDLRAYLDSGVNLKFLKNTEVVKNEEGNIESLILHPGGHCLVPTGIYTAFSSRYRVEIVPRSGLALKKQITITNSPGTIEGDYKNEWGIILDNEGDTDFVIKSGDKICQAIFSLIVRPNFIRVNSPSELSGEDRGGGFGHSGV